MGAHEQPDPQRPDGGRPSLRPITFRGHTYPTVEAMPTDVRAAYERTMATVRSVPREVPYDPAFVRRKRWDRYFWRAPLWLNLLIVAICAAIFVWVFLAY